ncbi:hypothetical protein [Capnocytophaga felis]|nr:hypothetical protein [Capnocytophaga felis]
MKRIITVVIFMLLVVFLQSCTINTEFIFHKDNTISTTLEVEVKSDSIGNVNSNDKKLPREWTSLYDFAVQEGKNVPPDSVDVLKRISTKGLYKEDKNIGFGLRFERMTDNDWKELGKSGKQEEKIISSLKQSSIDWNGKTLVLNVEELFSDNSDKDTKQNKKSKKKSEEDLGEQMGTAMLKAFDIQTNMNFKFENPIKSIKGKHRNFKQIDNHTVQFNFNLKDEISQDNKKKKYDKKIIITTE